MDLNKRNFISYYKKYKELSQFHQKLFEKKAKPNIPSLYSESLCRFLYNMKKSNIKEYDAIFEENKIEIKATSSNSGTTTINPYSKFDFLYWLYIDVETDRLQVTKIPYKNFEELFSTFDVKKDKKQKLRINICLNNFKQNCEIDDINLMTLSK